MATTKPTKPAKPGTAPRVGRAAPVRRMSPELQRAYDTQLVSMAGIHLEMLKTAAAKLNAPEADETACECAVSLINAICGCVGVALGSIITAIEDI